MCLAVPGEVLDIEGEEALLRQGRVAFAGVVRRVNLAFVPAAQIGDFVLVHAGIAIAVIDEAAARQTLRDLAAIFPDAAA
jgi:hydrogenase expression/formation protein HypC